MIDYFYYLGFLYLANSIIKLWICFGPAKEVINFDSKMSVTELMSLKEKAIEKEKERKWHEKSYISTLVWAIFFIWSILGYKFDLQEKNLFLLNVVVKVCYMLLLLYLNIAVGIGIVFGSKHTENNEKPRPTINITKPKLITEIVIVSIILCWHFLG